MYLPVPYLSFMVPRGSVAAYVPTRGFIRSTTTMERREEKRREDSKVGGLVGENDSRHPRQLKRGKYLVSFFFFFFVFLCICISIWSYVPYRTVPIEQLVHELNKQGAEHVAQASRGFT